MKVKSHRTIKHSDPRKGHFNNCEHLFVTIEPAKWQTISCALPNGRHVTFGFVPGGKDDPKELECVDIHTTAGPDWKRGEDDFWTQHLVGFTCEFSAGGDPFDTRRITGRGRCTLATLLLHRSHYENESTRPCAAWPERDVPNYQI